MSNQTYDVLVIGGGVVGASTAYHSVRAGVKTLLVDRHDKGRATDAGAGILAPETSSRGEPWFSLALQAVAYYPELLAHIHEDQGGETSYMVCGMLNVAATEDELDAYEQLRATVLARQKARGTPTPADLHEISPEEVRELFPALREVQAALYFRQAARVDGRQLAQAMRRAGQNRGLTIRQADVSRLVVENGRIQGVSIEGTMIPCGAVVIAGGAWSPHFAAQLGVEIPVEPQRGQIIHLDLPNVDTGSWPIVGAQREQYIVSWPNGHVAVGATRETGSGFAPVTTLAGLHDVMGEALRVAPGLGEASIHEIRVGLRPITPDGLPVIDAIHTIDNAWVATGHGPTGLQVGPFSGKLIAEMMQGAAPSADIRAFAVTRFNK